MVQGAPIVHHHVWTKTTPPDVDKLFLFNGLTKFSSLYLVVIVCEINYTK